ncbi:serine hydrolase-like protein 2 isoform X3 [Caretta caretta]|uniref:serine hydrolase-like protein 2 isoform X3 n=1 Tax=Caretta caretta TaxID=8467 RepID=UPI003F4BD3BB
MGRAPGKSLKSEHSDTHAARLIPCSHKRANYGAKGGEAPGDREDEMPSVLKWSSLPVAGMVSEMKFPVPWGHIAAKAWGSPQGHPMLCLHGWLDNANTFNRLIPLLPKDYCYMAMDFGGHGLSSHRPAGFPYHFLDYVSEVRRVTAALKWSRFTLMGHSLGGSVAGMESGAWLDSKRKVIESLLSLEENKPQPPKVRSPQEALQRLLQANSHLTEESGRILLQRGATEVLGGLVYNRDMRVLKHNLDPLTLEQFVSFLRKIQASVLMIIAQDGIFNPEAENMSRYFVKPLQEAFQSNLKHFQLAKVTGNHFVHLNDPEVVAGLINIFLKRDQSSKARL